MGSLTNPGRNGGKLYRADKGETRNPNGRPKGKSVSTVLNELLFKGAPQKIRSSEFVKQFIEKYPQATNAQAMAARLLFQAIVKGDMKAFEQILDRTEGKAKQSIDHTITGEKLEITIVGKKFEV